MKSATWNPIAGDGATICHYSDRTACTIARVSPSGKTLYLQSDIASLNGWKPEIIPGGFSGHCTNNAEQSYTYSPDTSALIIRASLRKDGKFRTSNNEPVIAGRHQFHDYNL